MPIPSPLTALCPAGALSSSPLAFHSWTLVPQSPLDNLKGQEWILSLPLTLPWPLSAQTFEVCQTYPCLLALSGSPCSGCHFLSPHWLPLQPTAPPSVGLKDAWPYGLKPGPSPG